MASRNQATNGDNPRDAGAAGAVATRGAEAASESVVDKSPSSTDGRVMRGERTRRIIAEALIALVEEGDSAPTARRVAERAGVSLRLVFHHYQDVETVFAAASRIQYERHWGVLRAVDPSLPLAERITSVCHQRRRLYEAISPVRRTAYVRAVGSGVITENLSETRTLLRQNLAEAFAPELDRDADADLLLDALEAAVSWETWDALRIRNHSSASRAEQVLHRSLEALLA